MFNLQGSEIIFILLIALVVLGPDKLPDAVKRFTQTYNELRKMGSGLQSELKSVIDEPAKQVRDTAAMLEGAVDPDLLGGDGLPGDETPRTGSKQSEPPAKADTTGDPDPEPESVPAEKSTTGDSSAVEAEESDVEAPAKPVNTIAAANSSAGLEARAAAMERARQAATERAASKANGDPDPVEEPDSVPDSAEPTERANSASERASDGATPA